MSEKPEQLFPGVEWMEPVDGVPSWSAECGPVLAEIWCEKVLPGDRGWGATVGNDEPRFFDTADALAWLRSKVIEARDELCRVTGTVATEDDPGEALFND